MRVDEQAGAVTVDLEDGRTSPGSHLFLAVGRSPNTQELEPGAAGVETDEHGYIKVDDELRTNVPGIYAAGDVKGARPSRTFLMTTTAFCATT